MKSEFFKLSFPFGSTSSSPHFEFFKSLLGRKPYTISGIPREFSRLLCACQAQIYVYFIAIWNLLKTKEIYSLTRFKYQKSIKEKHHNIVGEKFTDTAYCTLVFISWSVSTKLELKIHPNFA